MVVQVPCPARYYNQYYGGRSASDCALCVAGGFCPQGSDKPTVCPSGQYCVTGVSTPEPCMYVHRHIEHVP